MNNGDKIAAWFARFEHRMSVDVPRIVGETAVEYYKEQLIKKEWDGKPYAPYKYKSKEPTAGSLMMRTNNLFASIGIADQQPGRVRVKAGSSKVGYARVHNEGQRVRGIRNVRAYTNKNFMGKGIRTQIKPHTRKVDFQMPRRQFIGHSAILNKRIIQRLKLRFNSQR